MNDDLDEWADLLCPVPKPAPKFCCETEDEPHSFLAAPPDELLPRCLDPEAQAQRILGQVPEADPAYVQDLVRRSSAEFIDALLGPMEARGSTPRDRILRDGYVTAKGILPYDGRGIRYLEDLGIPLTKERVIEDGRRVLAYTFYPEGFSSRRPNRRVITRQERETLISFTQGTCDLCRGVFPASLLEGDHRVPFSRDGNDGLNTNGIAALQLLCLSCNRRKGTACRRCPTKDPQECRSCWWAYPESYTHIAGRHERRLTVVASTPDEMTGLDALRAEAVRLGLPCL